MNISVPIGIRVGLTWSRSSCQSYLVWYQSWDTAVESIHLGGRKMFQHVFINENVNNFREPATKWRMQMISSDEHADKMHQFRLMLIVTHSPHVAFSPFAPRLQSVFPHLHLHATYGHDPIQNL